MWRWRWAQVGGVTVRVPAVYKPGGEDDLDEATLTFYVGLAAPEADPVVTATPATTAAQPCPYYPNVAYILGLVRMLCCSLLA
jgi:hypothetical protein